MRLGEKGGRSRVRKRVGWERREGEARGEWRVRLGEKVGKEGGGGGCKGRNEGENKVMGA